MSFLVSLDLLSEELEFHFFWYGEGFRAIFLLSCIVLRIRSLCWEGAPGQHLADEVSAARH